MPLGRDDLPAETVALARFLLGKTLIHETPEGRASGRIVETEAYPPGDAAMHAYRGPTPRNRALFLRHGHAYVYICYGISFMLNVSSEAEGIGAGVLIRAVMPQDGIALMASRRGTDRLRDLARGPGRLAMAFAIDKRRDGLDLCAGGPLRLEANASAPPDITLSTRIGITRDAHRLLRFSVTGDRFVSGPRLDSAPAELPTIKANDPF